MTSSCAASCLGDTTYIPCDDPADADAAALRGALLNNFQRDFPRFARPFDAIAARLGVEEADVIAAYTALHAQGALSRIGPVIAPGRVGVSALAALAVSPQALDAVAERVSAVPEVNHNYLREHALNLWFVVTAASRARFDAVIARIARETGCEVLTMPLERAFHIDLAFDLDDTARSTRQVCPRWTDAADALPLAAGVGGGDAPGDDHERSACLLPALGRALLHALQDGLPLVAEPYAELGRRVGLSGDRVIEMIDDWLAEGVFARFGVVVRHHELGFVANAMCVWDVPDGCVDEVGAALASEPGVTLCYRRRRAGTAWPYNLYCMIHGRARESVAAHRDEIAMRHRLDRWPHAVLFSTRRFKQQGARYLAAGDA